MAILSKAEKEAIAEEHKWGDLCCELETKIKWLEGERDALARCKEQLSDTLNETLARSEGLRKERDALLEWRRGFVERARPWENVPAVTWGDWSIELIADLAAVDIEAKLKDSDDIKDVDRRHNEN